MSSAHTFPCRCRHYNRDWRIAAGLPPRLNEANDTLYLRTCQLIFCNGCDLVVVYLWKEANMYG